MRSVHGWRIPAITPHGDDAMRAEDGRKRPQVLPTPGDYMSDFALYGKRVLVPSRLILFQTYYLSGAEYTAARKHVKISERGWEQWTWEIRREVGRELLRCGVFPPRRYFKEPTSVSR